MIFSFDGHYLQLTQIGNHLKIVDADQHDQQPFACQLVFSQLGPWISSSENPVVNTSTSLIMKEHRLCLNSSIGQVRGCVGTKERTLIYTWVRNKMTYTEARSYCSSISAKLFDQFDGRDDTVELLCNNMHTDDDIWIGLTNSSEESVWITDRDQSMSFWFI